MKNDDLGWLVDAVGCAAWCLALLGIIWLVVKVAALAWKG